MNQTPATLSGYLLEKANRRLGYPKRIDPKTAEILLPVAEALWKDDLGPLAPSSKAPSVPESILDEFLCRVLLTKVPAIVRRASASPPLRTRRQPPDDVVVCTAEAFRCYVFEFWDASVALSRAALETALKQELHKLGIPPPEKLSEIIERSRVRRLLNESVHREANKIKDAGDKVLHGERATRKAYHADEAAAAATLTSLRTTIGHIYGAT